MVDKATPQYNQHQGLWKKNQPGDKANIAAVNSTEETDVLAT